MSLNQMIANAGASVPNPANRLLQLNQLSQQRENNEFTKNRLLEQDAIAAEDRARRHAREDREDAFNNAKYELYSSLEGAVNLANTLGEGEVTPEIAKMAEDQLIARIERISANPNANIEGSQRALAMLREGRYDELRAAPDKIRKYGQSIGVFSAPKSDTPTTLEKLFSLRDRLPEGDPRIAQVNAAIQKESTRAKGTSLSVDGDGNITFTQGGDPVTQNLGDPSKLNKEISKEDASQIAESQEASDAAQATVDLLNRAKQILPQIQTGKFSGSDTTLSLLSGLADVGLASAKEQTALLEEFDALSKELGAQALQLFGGSDTEKELEVAIRTNIERSKDEDSNKNIIDRKLRAMNVLQQRPDFEAAWLQRNGSLKNPDAQTGEYFGKAWRRYQRETAPDLFSKKEPLSVGRFKIEVVE